MTGSPSSVSWTANPWVLVSVQLQLVHCIGRCLGCQCVLSRKPCDNETNGSNTAQFLCMWYHFTSLCSTRPESPPSISKPLSLLSQPCFLLSCLFSPFKHSLLIHSAASSQPCYLFSTALSSCVDHCSFCFLPYPMTTLFLLPALEMLAVLLLPVTLTLCSLVELQLYKT